MKGPKSPTHYQESSWIPFIFLLLGFAPSLVVFYYSNWRPLRSDKLDQMSTRYSRRLPQVIGQRYLDDQELINSDKSHLYRIRHAKLSKESWSKRFLELEEDEETKKFIESSVEKSDWLFTQLYHNLAKTILGFFYEKTDINAILNRGSMFVFSSEHFRKLSDSRFDSPSSKTKAIDLGAGDGKITQIFKPFFEEVFATEASKHMQKSLQSKGVKLLDLDQWASNHNEYDLISCLNLLDRCEEPVTILEQIKNSLKPDGLAFIALVIPYSPFVEFPQQKRNKNHEEKLDIKGRSFEEQAESFGHFLEQFGFKVLKWTRLPYLCEGDLTQSVYMLDDVLFVVQRN